MIITGGSGFIGSHLMERYPNARNVDLKENRDIHRLQILDEDNTVIHLAAISSIPDSFMDMEKTMQTNIAGLAHVIKICEWSHARLIFASSSSVVDPKSPYAYSKLWGEQMIKLSGIDHAILRFGNVYGEGDNKSAIKIFLEEDKITINGDGKQVRSFIHVEDICDALDYYANTTYQGIFDVGTENLDINTVASYFNKPVRYGPKRLGDALMTSQMPDFIGKTKLEDWVRSQV